MLADDEKFIQFADMRQSTHASRIAVVISKGKTPFPILEKGEIVIRIFRFEKPMEYKDIGAEDSWSWKEISFKLSAELEEILEKKSDNVLQS